MGKTERSKRVWWYRETIWLERIERADKWAWCVKKDKMQIIVNNVLTSAALV